MKTNDRILPLVDPYICRDQTVITALEKARITHNADIAVAGTLIQHWSNGEVRRVINFESKPNGTYQYQRAPLGESPAYVAERWNPLHGLFVASPSVETLLLNAPSQDPTTLLTLCEHHKVTIQIIPNLHATSHLHFSLQHPIRSLLKSNQRIRDFAVLCHRFLHNLKRLWTEEKHRRAYYQELDSLLATKEVVLDLEFGGLGDLLCFSSLPRLLNERHGVQFYLTEATRTRVRNPEFIEIAFEINPYFKGYRDTPGFRPHFFLRDLPWQRWFSTSAKQNATLAIERQFDVEAYGLPEIYYQPTKLPGYEKTLLCDKNWFSGLKIGLYVDEALIEEVIKQWQTQGSDYTIEYCMPSKQSLRTYIDKIYSAGHFVCYLSGGNSLAAALKKNATVVLPENIDGAPIENFLFQSAPVTYRRRRSLQHYGIAHSHEST